MAKLSIVDALVYGVGYALLTAFGVSTIVPNIYSIPIIGLTIGAVLYYGLAYWVLTWIGRDLLKVIK